MILVLILVCPAGVWVYLFFFILCSILINVDISLVYPFPYWASQSRVLSRWLQLVCEEAALCKPDALMYLGSPTLVKASGISGCELN